MKPIRRLDFDGVILRSRAILARLLAVFRRRPAELVWEDTRDVRLDDTMAFGLGYDFDGLEYFREEADTPVGRFMVWPAQTGPCRDWCFYGGELGWYEQGFESAAAAKAEVQRVFG